MSGDVKPVYPEDVTKALAYMDDAGWTRDRMQGVLAIALGHLEQAPPRPEVHIMWADEEIVYQYTDYKGDEVLGSVRADTVYFVCPVCVMPSTELGYVQEATESASLEIESGVAEDGTPVIDGGWRGQYDTSGGDDWWLECRTRGCPTELSAPVWLEFID